MILRLGKYSVRIFGALLMILASSQNILGKEPEKPVTAQLNPGGISSSLECGKCHKDIYKTWKNSLHAEATDNPVFKTAYLQAYFERGDEARKTCLKCHAPIAFLNNDLTLSQNVTREGINCDYCHSIAEILPGGPRFEFNLLKQGPLQNVTSPVHPTRFNALFKQSQFCGGCHEYKSANGVKLIETYSEWMQGPYPAKGKQCQSCHMMKVAGKIVTHEVQQTPENEISSHDIAGGHSISKREESIDIKIVVTNTFKQKVEVTVNITNKGAGHKIPTGIPSKKIVLQVSIQSKTGETYQMHQKTYQKVLEDADGNPVTSDTDLLMGKAVKIISDNRIAPLETRREKFTFFVPEEKDQKISAAVFYDHNPKVIQPSPIHIKLHEVFETIRH